MGFDIRDIPTDALNSITAHLQERGFAVSVTEKPDSVSARGTLTQVLCRRGSDVQVLAWYDWEVRPGVRRIAIHNHGGWLPWVRQRRFKLQMDVTKAIEELGGHWPDPN